MKINKLLFGTALLPFSTIIALTSSACNQNQGSGIEGIKSIQHSFVVEQKPGYLDSKRTVLSLNITFNKDIKKVENVGSTIINGKNILAKIILPEWDREGKTTIKGQFVATAIDETIYTIAYSLIGEYTNMGSYCYYICQMSDLKFWDPTKTEISSSGELIYKYCNIIKSNK